MNNYSNINQVIDNLRMFQQQGKNPNAIIQSMFQGNFPVNQMQTQLNNVCQGRSKTETLLQLAKQQGLSEENFNWINQMLLGR